MNRLILFSILLITATSVNAQSDSPKYDQKLAKSLGADDYGMKIYVLAILKAGSNTTTDKKITDSLFAGHMANINRLTALNKLVVAGPLKANEKTYRGIFIFNVPTIQEAKELLITDPAISNKIFDVELYEWYGSAALPVYLESHNKIEKMKH